MVDTALASQINDYIESHELLEGEEPTGDISSTWVTQNEDLQVLEQPIPIIDFGEQTPTRNKEMEFRIIRRITETQRHNDNLEDYNPELAKLNRYNNIIPYKHSKVRVPAFIYEQELEDIDNAVGYVNANYINTVFNEKNKIIACQGPIPNSFQNFWKMIFYENVDFIFMLCNLRENNKPQCDEYWPKKIGAFFEWPKGLENKELKITLEAENILDQFQTERTFIVEKIFGELVEKKIVTQIQWTGWPDHGAPSEEDFPIVQKLIENMINIHILKKDKKIAVHCSAGVGRTGTFIAMFNLILVLKKMLPIINKLKIKNLSTEEKLKSYKISVFGVVRRLREQRWGMVHSSVYF